MRWLELALSGALAACGAMVASGQNSTRKIRPKPSAVAARAGTAVEWRADLAVAVEDSRDSGKPVFWYVPTIARSPMDRKPEIDRYMMAGPFSHPDVVALLNASFVPVRQRAAGDAAGKYGLQRGKFIEPGFLVLAADGAEKLRADRITTFHPQWFLARLQPLAAEPPGPRRLPDALAGAWRAYASHDSGGAAQLLGDLPADLSPELAAEAQFLRGAILHRTRRADQAMAVWREAGQTYPDVPYGWKAAAEAEGHGPFAMGFEDFTEVPEPALRGDSPSSRAPAAVYTEDELRKRSLRFLLAMQQPAGHYVDSKYDFGGTDSMPNVYMAVTALVGVALLAELPGDDPPSAMQSALEGIVDYICDDGHLNLDDRDEIVWAHAYRIHLLARLLERRPAAAPRLRPALERITGALQEMQPANGAWFHEYPNPFATASALLALHRAGAAGVEVDRQRIAVGMRALQKCRADIGAYTYGFGRGPARARVPAAAGRMPLCELALSVWDGSDEAKLEAAVRAGFEHHDQLESVRKDHDHANSLGYGGFFFWYDMRGRTAALLRLKDPELRRELAQKQRDIILSIPEFDGCFVDSHELGRVYGTAMALWCLSALRNDQTAPNARTRK